VADPDRIQIVVLDTTSGAGLRHCLQCHRVRLCPTVRPGCVALLKVAPDTLETAKYIRVLNERAKGRLQTAANYLRLEIPSLLERSGAVSTLHQLLYLDCDTIVRHNVLELLDAFTWEPGMVLAARMHAYYNYQRSFRPTVRAVFIRYYHRELVLNKTAFNNGVVLFNHAEWLKQKVTEDALYFLRKHAESPKGLWSLGSQPPFQLVGYGRWQPLPELWHVNQLGSIPVDPALALKAKLLHWSGAAKPWDSPNAQLAYLWTAHYSPTAACSCLDLLANATLPP
jgi:lipopolysaccharide biosynthesis glycosyltransferase